MRFDYGVRLRRRSPVEKVEISGKRGECLKSEVPGRRGLGVWSIYIGLALDLRRDTSFSDTGGKRCDWT